jgi:hypothetical protein
MDKLYRCVMPAEAGILQLQRLRDPRVRGDDSLCVFIDTLGGGNPGGEWWEGVTPFAECRMSSKRPLTDCLLDKE